MHDVSRVIVMKKQFLIGSYMIHYIIYKFSEILVNNICCHLLDGAWMASNQWSLDALCMAARLLLKFSQPSVIGEVDIHMRAYW